ncbi:unnamed protein product [Rodentolepis nana]|uniref:Uncharacterized protein n=1 Tax=Rodentolepis nana TaxID=102285 RepID=A0A0R3TBP0_RODNA|nr:unnamed protein product [Rodentolepis nana]
MNGTVIALLVFGLLLISQFQESRGEIAEYVPDDEIETMEVAKRGLFGSVRRFKAKNKLKKIQKQQKKLKKEEEKYQRKLNAL